MRALVLLLALLLAGCAPQMYQVPTSGLAWGYSGISSVIEGLQLVFYTPSKAACEIERARERREHVYAVITLSECQPISMTPGGVEYWAANVVGYPGYGLAFSEPGYCEIVRASWKGGPNLLSACGPITVQVLKGGR